MGAGYVLHDESDPIALQGLAFTLPATEALFWTAAGTAIEPGFGVGFIVGVLVGSLLTSVALGEFKMAGFDRETPTGNYIVGGLLMGVGMLSIASALALAAMIAGALLTPAAMQRGVSAQGGLVAAE